MLNSFTADELMIYIMYAYFVLLMNVERSKFIQDLYLLIPYMKKSRCLLLPTTYCSLMLMTTAYC